MSSSKSIVSPSRLEATVAEQRKEMETIIARLESKIQKVSAQVAANNVTPHMVAND